MMTWWVGKCGFRVFIVFLRSPRLRLVRSHIFAQRNCAGTPTGMLHTTLMAAPVAAWRRDTSS